MAFEDLRTEFTAHNVAILGCSNDSVEAQAKFANEHKFGYPLASDQDMSIITAYGAGKKSASSARRIAVLIDEQGKVAKVYDPAGTADFPALVLKDVKKDEL